MADEKKKGVYAPKTNIVKTAAPKPANETASPFQPIEIERINPNGTVDRRVCNKPDLPAFQRRGFKVVSVPEAKGNELK